MTSPATSGFEVQIFDNCSAYLNFCSGFMAKDPYSTNVISVVASGIVSGSRDQGPNDIFVSVSRNDTVIGIAMHTPPYRLFLSRMPASGASVLAATLFELEHHTSGVNGERSAVTAFAKTWSKLSGVTSVTEVATRLYKLQNLRLPANVPGASRLAETRDIGLLARWLRQFHDEAAPHEPLDDFGKTAARRINDSEIHLWISAGQPVSFAGRRPAVCDIARIGPVYTPHEFRGHGFGSAVTAAATNYALDLGARQVALYTDLSNPTSNSIYQKLGYLPDHDGEELRFT